MPQRQNATAKFGRDVVEVVAAMAAAHIASMRDVLCDHPQRGVVFTNYPFHVEGFDLFFQSSDRQLELSLFKRDGDQFVRKRRALLVGHERMQQRQAVFPSGYSDSNTIT